MDYKIELSETIHAQDKLTQRHSHWSLKEPRGKGMAIIILTAITLGIIGALINYCETKQISTSISFFITIGSFVGLIFTVYYAYRLVLVNWVPVGAFVMTHFPKDPSEILTFPENKTTLQNIEMWVNLNPTVNGTPVPIGGFYSAEHSWFIQPTQKYQGHFHIEKDILSKVGKSIAMMKQETNSTNQKTQLRFKVQIKFIGVETKIERQYPPHEYYYDFKGDTLIPDV